MKSTRSISDERQSETESEPESLTVECTDQVITRAVVRQMYVGETFIKIKMSPVWYEQENEQDAFKSIFYPFGITNERPYDAITSYRIVIFNKSLFVSRQMLQKQ
jgi:hypothetical protein